MEVDGRRVEVRLGEQVGAEAQGAVAQSLFVAGLEVQVAHAGYVEVLEVGGRQAGRADAGVEGRYAVHDTEVGVDGGATLFVLRDDRVASSM